MDVNDKDTNSVVACSPLSIREIYSPSPSTTNNNTPSTTNTTNMSTPNGTPNPITTTLPNTTHIKMESHPLSHPTHPSITYNSNIQPLLTSMNQNINVNNKENDNLSLNTSIPRIPLPNMMPKFTMNNLSLPPLPKEFLNKNKKRIISHPKLRPSLRPSEQDIKRYSQRRTHQKHSQSPIKMEIDSIAENDMSLSLSSSPEEYSIIRSAFNHNLRVKQEHLREEPILDTSFESCYIFSMRCPYADCCKLFNDMISYQNHHISKHQQRDKKGKLIQSKEAKWTCPECGKISASWYNYAAHVTMHKDSCDAPWICKLPPINKKKYVKWTDGTLICGKRCSTKHNLIKHLKALHTNHRIIDLSHSVKAQSIKSADNNRRISPRKNRKRPRFTKTNTISPLPLLNDNGIINVIKNNSFHNKHNSVPIYIQPIQPPKKRMKRDPNIINTNINSSSVPTALPIFSTGDNIENWSVTPVNHGNYNNNKIRDKSKGKKGKKQKKKSKKKRTKKRQSVQQQGDFVGLLLEAAQLIETEPDSSPKSNKNKLQAPLSATSSNGSTPITITNVNQLLNSIKTIFNSNANGLSKPISLEDFNELSAVFNITNSKEAADDDSKQCTSKQSKSINISNITNISSISIPETQSEIINNSKMKINNKHIMPNIAIIPNMPTICGEISPITPTNPAISLPKLPLPPPPPVNDSYYYNNNVSENGLESLLRLLNNKTKPQQLTTMIPIQEYNPPQISNIMVNANTFNTYNNFPLPLLPNLNECNSGNNIYMPTQSNILPITQSPIHKSKKDININDDDNTSVISNNILSALPPIIMNNDDFEQKSSK